MPRILTEKSLQTIDPPMCKNKLFGVFFCVCVCGGWGASPFNVATLATPGFWIAEDGCGFCVLCSSPDAIRGTTSNVQTCVASVMHAEVGPLDGAGRDI